MQMWLAIVWTSVGHPERALSIVDAGLAVARRDDRMGQIMMWTCMRTRALFDAGRLEDALLEAEGVLELEDLDLVGGALDVLLVTAVVRAALHAGRPDVVRSHRVRLERMTRDEQGSVRRNGSWLTALIADSPVTPRRRWPLRLRRSAPWTSRGRPWPGSRTSPTRSS
jgi:hypothetical protein